MQDIPGLQVIPVDANKVPLAAGWQKTQTRYDLSRFPKLGGIGIATGSISGNMEVIDIDQKYSLDGKLFDKYKRLVAAVNFPLISRVIVTQTRSGGFHIIYRCETIERNVKLAQRHSTDEERFENPADRVRVLIETRGEGGQVVVWPTPGYKVLNGSFDNIPVITPEERDTLIGCARQLNEVFAAPSPAKPAMPASAPQEGLSPGDDYNERGDVVELLEMHGWKRISHINDKIHFRRPGQTSAMTSGNYDTEKKWFSVFTTSTLFEPEKAYKPWHVFTILEANGDFSEAAKKLYELGYGERKKQAPSAIISEPERPPISLENMDFLASHDGISAYLRSVRDGSFKMGLTTGFSKLDQHFLYKQGNFVVVNGHANVGKTVVLWYLALLSSIRHGWKWSMMCSENSAGGLMRKMCEFYWRKPLKHQSEKEFRQAYEFVKEHFYIIRNDESYNYEQLLEMFTAVNAKYNIQSVLVDTYNSLEVPGKDAYQHHYNTLNAFRYWSKNQNCCVYVNAHPGTAAMRTRDDNGHPKAPMMADTEQGTMFAAKADDFLTIHRKVNDESDWRKTEIHVRKVKEVETGGRPTPLTEPFIMEMNDYCRFEDEQGIDPVLIWQHQLGSQQNFSTNTEKAPF